MASALHKGERAVEATLIPATAQSTGFGTYTLEAPLGGTTASDLAVPSSSNMDSNTPTVTSSPTLKAADAASTHSLAHQPTLGQTVSNEKAAPRSEGEVEEGEGSGLLTGFKLYAVFTSLMLACFMFALDQSIVATAIPVIVSDFRAFAEVSWVITAYFLTQCGLILLVGQLLTFVKAKWILLAAIFFFELGSLLCAVAQNMPLLIFGRAVQGIGAAGLFVSMLSVIVTVTTLKQRPAFMATFGFVFVVSSVVGPLLGGVFTERATWRWCFWINLPLGAIAAAAVVFFLPPRQPIKPYPDSPQGWKALQYVDWIGAGLVLAMITCLLLALQWGGNDYAWGNWRIILLFTLGGILVFVFLGWQYYRDQHALIPLSLLRNRTQLGSMGAMAFLMVGMLGGTYQLPLFYQATRGRTPEQSGIDIIPFMLAVCIGIFIQGGFVTKFGRYYYPLIIGTPISAVGFGLLYTMDAQTPNPRLIGFQILAGVGIGISFQNPLLAIQTEYHDRPHLIPQANGVVSFAQLTGAALGIGIVNTVQSVFLNRELTATNTGIDVALVRQSPVAIYQLAEDVRGPVINAYVRAITESLIPIIVACGLAWIISFFIKNKSTLGKVKEMAMA